MGWLHFIKKICSAVTDGIKGRKQGVPRLIMTLLVRNEELILEQNILFHKEMGVDAFIITDNNSTDSTPEIIQKYVDKGWIVESIKDTEEGHLQKTKVDKMICSAKENHNADWVINCDADELWYSPQGNLKSEMMGLENALRCRVVGTYPQDDKPFWKWDKFIRPMPDTSIYDLSPYNIYRGYTYKVAHTTKGYIRISMGNHKVTMLPKHQKNSEITIYHYNILGIEPFTRKMVNGGKQVENNPKKSESRHWRYFYGLYKSGELAREYYRVIGGDYYDEFLTKGYIYQDETIANIFKKIYKK